MTPAIAHATQPIPTTYCGLFGDAHDDPVLSAAYDQFIHHLAAISVPRLSYQVSALVDAESISSALGSPSSPWRLDPIPLVIGPGEWQQLAAGLEQRALLLDLILRDIYGPRHLLHDGTLPAQIIFGHDRFLPSADKIVLPTEHQLLLGATDLMRGADGQWKVVTERSGVPAGTGFAMAGRRILSRVLDQLYRTLSPYRLRGFFDQMEFALREASSSQTSNPQIVYLTGPHGDYDQALISSLLGYPLAQTDDLMVEDGRLWLRMVGGRRQQVDVILRGIDSGLIDPLDLLPDSQLGVPGIVAAAQAGRLSVVNPIGSGVLENAGLTSFMPRLAQRLLSQDLMIDQPASWWAGEPAGFSHIKAHLDELVIRPISRTSGSPRLGWALSDDQKTQLLAEISAKPWAWVGQEYLPGDSAPVVVGDHLEPRTMVLRSFYAAAGSQIQLMRGGLARLANAPHRSLLETPTGASIIKDVWVLPPETDRSQEQAPLRLIQRRDENRRVEIAPRLAADLYQLGRFTERTEATARLLMVADNLAEDHINHPETPGYAAMSATLGALNTLTHVSAPTTDANSQNAEAILDQLTRLLTDASQPGSLAHSVNRTGEAAWQVRALLSLDTSSVIHELITTMDEATQSPDHVPIQPVTSQLLRSCLALSGMVAESTTRDEIWAFMEAGRRIERAQASLQLVAATLAMPRPPIVESLVTETVLRSCDSLLTYRRRMATGVGSATPVAAAMQLLIADPSNPRSVIYQLRALRKALRQVPDTELEPRTRVLVRMIKKADIETLCHDERHAALGLLDELEHAVRDIAGALESRHLMAAPRPHPFAVFETGLVRPGARRD